MTCRELTEFLGDYVSGDLPQAQRTIFEEHLGECQDCVAYLRSYETTVRLGKAAYQEAATQAVPEALVRAILAARRGK
jgi:anti-sigma factor RsiW